VNLTLLGAGAWGTALAIHASARHPTRLWARDAEQATRMRSLRRNARYLPEVPLPPSLQISTDFDTAIEFARGGLVVIATPMAGLHEMLRRLPADAPGVLWLCKGFEQGTGLLPHQIAEQTLGAGARCGALSGPSFAAEVARGLPCALTLAAHDAAFAREAAALLHGGRMRVYYSADLVGVGIGGAVKNVMAIAAGISDGLGLGYNARAALITRGLAEITRLGTALGGAAETFMGLAGAGDLILTATGDLSRNRRVGLELASGKRLNDILVSLGHVAEGVYTAREVAKLAKTRGVDMPVTEAVNLVLEGKLAPKAAVEQLLARDPKRER
jgi:glycerol-3-phosphate dehydrogenase (NAD(P)+)